MGVSNIKKVIYWILFIAFLLIIGWFIAWFIWGRAKNVEAREEHKIAICHCEPRKGCHTIEIDEHAWDTHERHHGDYKGECKIEPKFHSICVEDNCVLAEGEGKDECKIDKDCEEDIPTPTPTEEPKAVVQEHSGSVSAPAEPICKDLGGYVPTITKVWRVDTDTVGACWTKPSDNATAYEIWYGSSENNLPYNVITNDLCIEINGMTGTTWFKVAGKNEGCVGNYSIITDP